jgi:DNA-binding response OmpR family regulator
MRILVVEDEDKMAKALRRGLQEQGYEVDVAGDGLQGEAMIRTQLYDLVILDWMLPGQDGPTLCRHVRERGEPVPILLLTARGDTDDRVRGLDSGADDYLAKPFAYAELLARVRALLRRRGERGQVLRVADLELDPGTQTVRRAGRQLDLTAKEYALLEYLLRHAGQALPRKVLSDHVWGEGEAASNVVDVYIGYLRQKIGPEPLPRLIHTVRGTGYVLRQP